jgi:DNA primase
MLKLGYTYDELVVGFLCGKSEKGNYYDVFRNRVMFPIIDVTGNVIAFGGRVMDDSKPKYLNTSDTPAFKKSRHLFALNFARKHSEEYMILCEGYMDVIALHAAGFENAVATLGTAITSEQARVFAKYTKKVIICYDSDEAGQNAASKAMRLLNEAGLEVKVLSVVGAKDPDEFIKKYGAEKFKSLLGESKSGFDFKLEKIVGKYNLALPEDKIKASSEVCELIAVVGSEVERDIYIRRASDVLGNNTEAMKNDVERVRYRKIKEYKKKEGRDAQLSVKNIGDRVNLESSKNIRASNSEEAVIALMLIYDEFRQEAAKGQAGITPNDFVTDFGRRVFEEICKLENSEGGFSKALLGQYFSVEEMGRIEKLEVERRRLAKNDKEVFLSCIESIKQEKNALSLSDGFDDLKARQEMLRKAKERKDPKISGIK